MREYLRAFNAAFAAFLALVPPSLAALPAAEAAEIYIITPGDGEVVANPVTFGLKGTGVAPAGGEMEDRHLPLDADFHPSFSPSPRTGATCISAVAGPGPP